MSPHRLLPARPLFASQIRCQRYRRMTCGLLSYVNVEWAKRSVRETAALCCDYQPEDIALLPDIGEAL